MTSTTNANVDRNAKSESDALWNEQFASTADVLDAVALGAAAEVSAKPFVDDEAW